MNELVASNFFLEEKANELLSYMNSGWTLRLFQNDITPAPETSLGEFVECDFGGYEEVSLSGAFSGPTKVQDGQYQIVSEVYQYTSETGASQDVFGLYIDNGTDWCFAYRFPIALHIEGIMTFSVQVKPSDWAKSII